MFTPITGAEECRKSVMRAHDRGSEAVGKKFCVILTLWVLKTNLPPIEFYKQMGFVPDGATKTDQLNDFTLHEIRFALSL